MRGKPVIVAVDGSRESAQAAAWAWRFADAARASCRPLHVVPDVWLTDQVFVPAMPSRTLLDEVVDGARHRLAAALREWVPAAALEALDVRVGRPETVLRDVARETGAQLVVLGGKHHTALGRALGGSTAQHLVRTVDVPLVVVTGTAPPRRVLAALDLSPAARPTVTLARRVARLFGAALRLLHVVEPARLPLTIPFAVDEDDVYRRSVAAFERLGVGAGEPAGERVTRRGPAADSIAADAKAWGADLIVVGSHGKGWADRLLIGSVTERLLALLPATVLVVPTARPAPRGPVLRPRAPARRRGAWRVAA
jgi:nucleotide-binding universal stress UspA family protein